MHVCMHVWHSGQHQAIALGEKKKVQNEKIRAQQFTIILFFLELQNGYEIKKEKAM